MRLLPSASRQPVIAKRATPITSQKPDPGILFSGFGSASDSFEKIVPREDGLPPGLVVEVPVDGLFHAGFEGFPGCPPEAPLNLRCINGIAEIVSGTILHVGDEVFVFSDSRGFPVAGVLL